MNKQGIKAESIAEESSVSVKVKGEHKGFEEENVYEKKQ